MTQTSWNAPSSRDVSEHHLSQRSAHGHCLPHQSDPAARRARALLDVRVAYHSRSRASVEDEAALGATYHDSLPALLAASDIVSLHCPGGAATRHLLNRQALECMKPTAILINTARGSVVDESALADALSRGVIAAAGLDVYEG